MERETPLCTIFILLKLFTMWSCVNCKHNCHLCVCVCVWSVHRVQTHKFSDLFASRVHDAQRIANGLFVSDNMNKRLLSCSWGWYVACYMDNEWKRVRLASRLYRVVGWLINWNSYHYLFIGLVMANGTMKFISKFQVRTEWSRSTISIVEIAMLVY